MANGERTHEDHERHLCEMERLLLDGRAECEVVLHAVESWGVSAADAQRDVALIKQRWAERGRDGDAELGKAITRREQLYERAVDREDDKQALRVEQDRCRLIGLYANQRPKENLAGGRAATALDFAPYISSPIDYAKYVLKITPTPDQEKVARAVLQSPHRVLVRSGHNIGKTFLAAWLVNWWFDTRDPGVVVTTAPTKRDVIDLLWTEVRLQRARAQLPSPFIGPAAPHMQTHPEHYAKGFTARKGESFQGRHRANMLFVFDEAEGVDAAYWKTADTMFQPDGTNAFLAILNPTTTTSQSAQEERALGPDGAPKWTVFSVSALDHPNVTAGLDNIGRAARSLPPVPVPVPAAVTLDQVNGWIADWFEEVPAAERDPDLDIEWPPGSGRWLRPDPDGEARVLGRRPSAGAFGVWTEKLWQRACATRHEIDCRLDLPEIGCDVAGFGADRTEFHVRCGCSSLHHEDHGGWDSVPVADRLMELADEYARWATALRDPKAPPIEGKRIRIKVDDTGVGFGVSSVLRSRGYNCVPVNAGSTPDDPRKYPRKRDELWFVTRDRAKAGRLDLTRLPDKRQGQLMVQALAPIWWPTPDRRRQVESKEDTRARLKMRSPDGMDAVNLAYCESGVRGGAVAVEGRGLGLPGPNRNRR
jgi:hypothetical protein